MLRKVLITTTSSLVSIAPAKALLSFCIRHRGNKIAEQLSPTARILIRLIKLQRSLHLTSTANSNIVSKFFGDICCCFVRAAAASRFRLRTYFRNGFGVFQPLARFVAR